MKELILYPPIFGALLFGALGSFIILFYLTKDKIIATTIHQIADYIFLFIVSGVTTFPFSHLDIRSIGTPEKGLFSALLLIIIYTAALILLRVQLKQIIINIIILLKQRYLGFYIALLIFSTLWSGSTWLSFKAAISLIAISVFAVYFARQFNWQQIFKLLRWNQTFIAFYSAFLAIFDPSEGRMTKGWSGAVGHPIDLGNMMALTASLWLLHGIQNPKYRPRSFFFAVICTVIMQLANSAGAFIVFISLIVIIFIPAIFRKLNFLQANLLFTLIMSFFGMLSVWVLGNLNSTFSLLDKDLTLTGRVPLWNLLIESRILPKLWLGYGYSGFWQPWQGANSPSAIITRLIGEWAVHAHNGFLDIILNLGLIGFSLFVLCLITNIGQSIKLILENRTKEIVLPLVILTFILVSNLSQTSIIAPSYVWFLFVLVTVRLQLDKKLSREKKEAWFSYQPQIPSY
ncbi:O-antigen polymerase [Chondrocystis sp. NIES-4102]|nr:O-antigen polymerase [Chondrocystis sp. NIES-4102]